MYDYDRRTITAGRVTFKPFGRIDGDGGKPADILLDGVLVGEITREVEQESVGVMQKKYTTRAYVPSLQGPIGDAAGADAFEDKEFESLPELKRALTAFLSKLPEGVSEAYKLYWAKKITPKEWAEKVKPLL